MNLAMKLFQPLENYFTHISLTYFAQLVERWQYNLEVLDLASGLGTFSLNWKVFNSYDFFTNPFD